MQDALIKPPTLLGQNNSLVALTGAVMRDGAQNSDLQDTDVSARSAVASDATQFSDMFAASGSQQTLIAPDPVPDISARTLLNSEPTNPTDFLTQPILSSEQLEQVPFGYHLKPEVKPEIGEFSFDMSLDIPPEPKSLQLVAQRELNLDAEFIGAGKEAAELATLRPLTGLKFEDADLSNVLQSEIYDGHAVMNLAQAEILHQIVDLETVQPLGAENLLVSDQAETELRVNLEVRNVTIEPAKVDVLTFKAQGMQPEEGPTDDIKPIGQKILDLELMTVSAVEPHSLDLDAVDIKPVDFKPVDIKALEIKAPMADSIDKISIDAGSIELTRVDVKSAHEIATHEIATHEIDTQGKAVDVKALGANFVDARSIDSRSAQVSSESLKPIDPQAAVMKPVDMRALGAQPNDTQAVPARPADGQSMDVKAVNMQALDIRNIDMNAVDIAPVETKVSDMKLVDLKTFDVQSVDFKTADMKTADMKTADLKSLDLKSVAVKSLDSKTPHTTSTEIDSVEVESTELEPAEPEYIELETSDSNALNESAAEDFELTAELAYEAREDFRGGAVEMSKPLHSAADTLSSLGLAQTLSAPLTQQSAIGAQLFTSAPGQILQSAILQEIDDGLIAAKTSPDGVSIRLDPPEMGRVYIDFSFEKDGVVTAIMRSENADIQAQLRDRSEHFLNLLKESGLSDVDLSFELYSDDGSQSSEFSGQAFGNDAQEQEGEPGASAPAVKSALKPNQYSYSTAANDTRLNLVL